ncbi:MAG: zinc metallopeptidase [bacterium]
MFYFDPTFVLLIPVMILALYAQFRVRRTYEKFSKVQSSWGRRGANVAQDILGHNQLHNVSIEQGEGKLSDHYDPRTKKVVLSPENYNGHSIAALSVAAHEVGHAIQHKIEYAPLQLRHSILPVANIGSTLAFPLFLIGLFMSIGPLMQAGVILFSGVVLFQLITLPVEFDASARAIRILQSGGYLTPQEVPLARKVLNAAALTYVAATAVALVHLLRLIILSGSRD